jgi:hypothetical protein
VAYPTGNQRAGVTCGWRDARNLARGSEDDRDDNDANVVRDALEFMVGEINTALAANGTKRHSRVDYLTSVVRRTIQKLTGSARLS